MDLRRTDIKQQNKYSMFIDLPVFSNMSTIQDRSKTNVFEWYNLQRNSSGKKKGKRTAMLTDCLCLTNIEPIVHQRWAKTGEAGGKNHLTIRKQSLVFPHVTQARLEPQRLQT